MPRILRCFPNWQFLSRRLNPSSFESAKVDELWPHPRLVIRPRADRDGTQFGELRRLRAANFDKMLRSGSTQMSRLADPIGAQPMSAASAAPT